MIIAASTAAFLPSCKKDVVKGCTNTDAFNYDSKATEDDGTCIAPLQVQKTTLMDFTGVECGICSATGIPCFMQAIKDNPSKVVPFGVHCGTGDPMNNNTSLGLSSAYNVSGIPQIAVGNTESVNISAASLNAAIASNTASAASVGMVAKMTANGNLLSISARVKFFSALSGEYWLAVYAMENGVVAHQINMPDPFSHFHVIRGCANQTGGYRGEKIVVASVAAGTIIDKTYSYTLPAGCNAANAYISLVLWKKETSSWKFVNAN